VGIDDAGMPIVGFNTKAELLGPEVVWWMMMFCVTGASGAFTAAAAAADAGAGASCALAVAEASVLLVPRIVEKTVNPKPIAAIARAITRLRRLSAKKS
jgi:hypothetical protein